MLENRFNLPLSSCRLVMGFTFMAIISLASCTGVVFFILQLLTFLLTSSVSSKRRIHFFNRITSATHFLRDFPNGTFSRLWSAIIAPFSLKFNFLPGTIARNNLLSRKKSWIYEYITRSVLYYIFPIWTPFPAIMHRSIKSKSRQDAKMK